MNPVNQPTIDVLVLETSLYKDRETLANALQALAVPANHFRSLDAANMNDSDWDDILNQILSARRVITL